MATVVLDVLEAYCGDADNQWAVPPTGWNMPPSGETVGTHDSVYPETPERRCILSFDGSAWPAETVTAAVLRVPMTFDEAADTWGLTAHACDVPDAMDEEAEYEQAWSDTRGHVDKALSGTEETLEIDLTDLVAVLLGASDRVSVRLEDASSGAEGWGMSFSWASATLTLTTASEHTIAASSGAHGSISPDGATVVADGEDQAYAITPDPLWQIGDVVVDGVSVGAVSTYTFEHVTADHSISATFGKGSTERIQASGVLPISIEAHGAVPMELQATGTLPLTVAATGQIATRLEARGVLPMQILAHGVLILKEN